MELSKSIIAAATDEFYAKGYEKASMRDIAKSANISITRLSTKLGENQGFVA